MVVEPWIPLVVPVLALAVNCVGQILVARFTTGHFWRSVIAGFLLGGAALVASEVALALRAAEFLPALIEGCLPAAPTYVCLGYCYFSFVNLGQSSVRIRLYAELKASPEGLTRAEIDARYDERALLQLRLDRLLEAGDLRLSDGRYTCGRTRFVRIARVVWFAKWVLLGRERPGRASPQA